MTKKPVDLTLIYVKEGTKGLINYLNSYDFKPDDQFAVEGKTYTVGYLKRKYAAHLAKLHKLN